MIKRLSKFLLVLVLIAGWIFSGYPLGIPIAEAVTTETFTTSTTWTAPTGVTSVTAEVWGGGGGGGGENATTDGGGGGGGGAYSKKAVITVVPGNNYTVTVGAAGTGSAGCTASTAGGDSWFSTTGTVLAKGGSPGACSTGTPPEGGAGGVAASGVGDAGAVFSGGAGEKGRNSNVGRGGYGGSSAGTAAAGWSGPTTWSTVTYPTASTPTGGGHGGDGGLEGVGGSAPASGNGGGGGGAGDGTNMTGGNGAVGKVILTYNKPPNAPTQDSPANAATGVSVTPTFLMTATDADTSADNLSYKVTIYSNSPCTTVVQTNDQAVSSTGWTGTNASCTASPTSCYTSGTQGSFLTQTALSNSTQYWWKASAKDPDGNGSFTNSSTCNTFTTAAAASLTFVVSTNTFPTITPGVPVFATTTLSIDTNNSTGWNVTVSGDDVAAGGGTCDLDADASVNLTDLTPQWINPTATTTAGNAVTITLGDNVLGFRVMTASGSVPFRASTWWGSTDGYPGTSLWAGIASSTVARKIGDSSVSCAGANCALNTVIYYLDVPASQQQGAYSCPLTYTATMNNP